MTDIDIEEYLNQNNWSVIPNDFIHDVMNTSPQIIRKIYDFENKIMTIETPEKSFTFHWNIKEIYKEGDDNE